MWLYIVYYKWVRFKKGSGVGVRKVRIKFDFEMVNGTDWGFG